MHFEVPALLSLGYEVYVPKVIPGSGFRSGAVSFEYDSSLSIPADDLERLNQFNFYSGEWTPQIERLVNRYFACAFVRPFGDQIAQAVVKFAGQIVFRAFGLHDPTTYRDVITSLYSNEILDRLKWVGNRFWFGEGYTQLHQAEDGWFKERAVHLPIGLPDRFFQHERTWRGDKAKVLAVIPSVMDDKYYRAMYSDFKRDVGDLPHVIIGHQGTPVDDVNVLGHVTDDELTALLQDCAAFYYPSRETRHVHYPPIEAAIVGLPVIYWKGSLFDSLCPESTIGAVTSVEEARTLLARILDGDQEFINALRLDQRRIADGYQTEVLRQVWRENLQQSGLKKAIEAGAKGSRLIRSVLTFAPSQVKKRLEESRTVFAPFKSPALAKAELGSSIYDGVSFTEVDLPKFIYSLSGLGVAEQYGRWSNTETVTIALRHLLDTDFFLELAAFGYGKNAGAEVEVKVGDVIEIATFGSDYTNIVPAHMSFSLTQPTNRIEIRIPHPTSPPNDLRRIGLAFTRLQAHPIKSTALAKEELGSSLYDGVSFTDSDLPAFIHSLSGLDVAEHYGRWSDDETVTIVLKHLLEGKFSLELAAIAYGPNVGAEVEVKIGDVVQTATFGSDYTNIRPAYITFSLRRPANRIEIRIPHPTSPPNDLRRIGLAFTRLQAHSI
jgi:hypothetical protein